MNFFNPAVYKTLCTALTRWQKQAHANVIRVVEIVDRIPKSQIQRPEVLTIQVERVSDGRIHGSVIFIRSLHRPLASLMLFLSPPFVSKFLFLFDSLP